GTFSKYTVVNQMSCVKILDDIPLELACLVGCGVTTGWGSSVYAAKVQPGDNVGGIGVRPPGFGAPHPYPWVPEAFEPIQQETWGGMCDKVICAMGVGRGNLM